MNHRFLSICLYGYSEQEANQLKQQIDAMTDTLNREKEKAAELELNTRFFDLGKSKEEEVRKITALSLLYDFTVTLGSKKKNKKSEVKVYLIDLE